MASSSESAAAWRFNLVVKVGGAFRDGGVKAEDRVAMESAMTMDALIRVIILVL